VIRTPFKINMRRMVLPWWFTFVWEHTVCRWPAWMVFVFSLPLMKILQKLGQWDRWCVFLQHKVTIYVWTNVWWIRCLILHAYCWLSHKNLLWFSAVVQGEFGLCTNIPGLNDCSIPHSLFGALFINLLLLIQWIHCH